MQKVDRPRTRLVFWVSLVAVALVVFSIFGPGRQIQDVLLWISRPVVGIFTRSAQSQAGVNDRVSLADLQDENDRLKTQVEDLIIENAKLTTRLDELSAASPAANLLQERTLPFLLARTTNAFSYQDASSILIDKGEADGVRVGQAVVYREGYLVGVVREVLQHAARVRLVFDNDIQLSATFAGDGAPQGIVTGELGLALRMELIPRDTNIPEHATVLTAGVEEAIPQGLIIGEVQSVTDPGSELFKTAQLVTPWQINELTTVAVVTL